jgi:RNA polymerase sigma-70 factor (ECF subfamily)
MAIQEADFEDLALLRCFGRALVRDERQFLTESQISQLVDRLIRQAGVGVVGGSGRLETRRQATLFSRFIDLHRRHVRRCAHEENDAGWSDGAQVRGERKVVSSVRALPLEQREALLLVVIGGFAHREAAEVLDLSLNQFFDRLEKGRVKLSACLAAEQDARTDAWDRSPHLRIVK